MADAIAAHPWSRTPLGDSAAWPEALKTLVGVMLGANQPMFVVWGPARTLIYNDRYAEILGTKHPGALGRPFMDVWPEVADELRPLFDQVYAGEPVHMDDISLMLERNGYPEEAHFAFSYTPVRAEDGAVAGFFCPCTETTGAIMAARAERERETRAHQILDSVTDYAIIVTDPDGRVTDWNEGAHRTLGWTEAEMRGEPVDRIFTPEDLEIGQPHAEMRGALDHGSAPDIRWHLRRDGERFWANGEMTPLRGEDGVVLGFVKILRDQTEQRRAADELRHSRERLADALSELRALNESLETEVAQRTAERDRLWETSPDLLVVLAFDGAVKRVNPAWTAILGFAPEELIGRHIDDLVAPEDRNLTQRALADAAGGPLPIVENRYAHKDGSLRWFSWVAAPTETEIFATGRHITADKEAAEALRRAEDQLRQSQKVEAVGQLTGGVAHDFNNLLTVIRGSVDLLRRPGVSEEKRLRYIEAISQTTDRATKLTNQLLAFARRQSLKPELFDVGTAVTAISDMVGTLSGSRIAVEVRTPPAPLFVNTDRSQLDNAIVNMAANARDAMEGEGSLRISVAPANGIPAVRAHRFTPGDFVAVSIRDTGSGIPADKIDHIFEPFFTTKDVGEGTGLGLSQVFGFAKQAGGEVLAESVEGKGATFTLYLPRVADDGARGNDAESGGIATIGEGACVLVVEDNAEVGAFATQALAELGYGTVFAPDGRAALDALAADGDRFDVVFSDVVMPGMSGIELGEEIRRLRPGLPVILTSGYSDVLAREGDHGFELLRKPYSLEELSRVLRRVAAWRERR